MDDAPDDAPGPLRDRILDAAARLLAAGGPEAATTRAVAAAAGVQAPALYRLFGDKAGLMEAAAERALAAHVGSKAARPPGPDALADLREGWDGQVAFGLAHPGLHAVLAAPGRSSPSGEAGRAMLRGKLARLAAEGRLRLGVESATALMHAVGAGVVAAGVAAGRPDPRLSEAACEAVLAVLTGEPATPAGGAAAGAALLLREALGDPALPGGLSAAERALMAEWLGRIAGA